MQRFPKPLLQCSIRNDTSDKQPLCKLLLQLQLSCQKLFVCSCHSKRVSMPYRSTSKDLKPTKVRGLAAQFAT